MCSANYFIFGAYKVHFMHDHSMKLPVCGSNGPTFIVSPKCFLNGHLGVAGTLAKAHKIVNDTHTFLYGDSPDPSCNCCLHVADCLGIVFVHCPPDNPKSKPLGV